MRHRAAVLGKLRGAQTHHVLDALDRARVGVGSELLMRDDDTHKKKNKKAGNGARKIKKKNDDEKKKLIQT